MHLYSEFDYVSLGQSWHRRIPEEFPAVQKSIEISQANILRHNFDLKMANLL